MVPYYIWDLKRCPNLENYPYNPLWPFAWLPCRMLNVKLVNPHKMKHNRTLNPKALNPKP